VKAEFLGSERGDRHGWQRWDSVIARPASGAMGRKKKGLIGGAYMLARENALLSEYTNSNGRHLLLNGPRHIGLTGPSVGGGGLGEAGSVRQCWAGFRGRFKIEIAFEIPNEF
jgi:hypothetical protein